MEKAKTHLGTPELHKRHSVMVEGGKFPRSKVMDQHIFDRYLMDNLINLRQHHAAEYLLGQAAKAQLWPVGANLSGTGGTKPGSRVPFGMFPFGRTLVKVRRRYGNFHVYIVKEVVCFDMDISGDELRERVLCEGLDFIADHCMTRPVKNPVRHLRDAQAKPAY